MSKHRTAFGLDAGRVARLFKVAAQDDKHSQPVDSEQQKAELLSERLSKKFNADAVIVKALLGRAQEDLESLDFIEDKTVLELVLDKRSNRTVLEKVKQYGARLSRAAQSEVEEQTANVIYYAAIAGSVVFLGEKITELSYTDLEKSFRTLSKVSWITQELNRHFSKAASVCQEKARRQDQNE